MGGGLYAGREKPGYKRHVRNGHPVRDAGTGKMAKRIAIDDNGLGEFAFSPDGKTLVVMHSHPEGPIEMSLWDVAGGKELDKWPTRLKYGGFGLQFSLDGRVVAATGGSEVDLWDPSAKKELPALLVPKDGPPAFPLYRPTFSPDGRTLAACGNMGVISLGSQHGESAPPSSRAIGIGSGSRFLAGRPPPDFGQPRHDRPHLGPDRIGG